MQDISNSIRALDQLDKQLQIDAKNADTNAYNARTNRINAQTSARAVDVQAQSVQVTQLLGLLNWHTTNTAQELKNVGQKLQNKFDRMTLADRTAVVKATLQHYREQIVYLQKQNKWFDIQQINQQINLLVNTFKQGTESYKNITEGVRNIVGMIPIVGKLMR